MEYSCWIDKEFKKYYSDSSKNGLRYIFNNGTDNKIKLLLIEYISFLRKRYFFPIRCYIHFTNDFRYISLDNKRKYSYGVFLNPDEVEGKFPVIYLPIKLRKNGKAESLLYDLTILLTFYFQWYFFEDKKRSEKSLMIEANEYAYFLVNTFLNDR